MRKYTMAAIFFIAVFFSISLISPGQHQSKADSLKSILMENDTLSLSSKMSILNEIATKSSSPDEKLLHADLLIELASEKHQVFYKIKAYQHKGVAYRLKGDLTNSLKNLFLSTQMALNNQLYDLQAEAYLEIVATYAANVDLKNVLIYEKKAVDIIRKYGDHQQLAINLLNTGFSYYTLGELDSALMLYNEAEPLFDRIDLEIGKAYTIGNRALVYWKKGKHSMAELGLLNAIAMLKPLGDQFGMADYHNQLGRLYLEQQQVEKAIVHTQKALAMAKSLDLKEQIKDAVLLLSQLYTREKKYQQALNYQTQYIAYKDSISNNEQTKEIANLRTTFEVSLREKEIDLLENRQALQRTYIIIAIVMLALTIALLLYFRQRFKTTRLLSTNEKKRHAERIKDLMAAQETKVLYSMIKGRDDERKRLAQELHNHLGSLLATIKVNLNGLPDTQTPQQQTIVNLVNQACNDIRSISHTLNMGVSENFGLVPALHELKAHLEQPGDLSVEFTASQCESRMDARQEIIIYRIVQELVSNALKHAEATQISIQLTCFDEEHLINIIIQDNGKGFDTEAIAHESSGMGLSSLKEIVAHQQGDITFDSNLVSGTTVTIDLPIALETNPI